MKELAVAILERFNSTDGATLRGLVTGGMWRDQAPRGNTNYPIVLFNFPAASVDPLLNADHDIQNVTFSIFTTNEPDPKSLNSPHDPTDQIDVIYAALIALYDNVIMTLTNDKNIVHAQRIGKNIVTDPDSGRACHVQYNYRIG